MKPLFSPSGLKALATHLATDSVVVFDFDGVLAPHRATRAGAKLRPATLQTIKRILRLAPVGVVTGRSVADVKGRLGFAPAYLVGNHGVEGLARFKGHFRRARQSNQAWSRATRKFLSQIKGTSLDDKRVSLTLHYSQSSQSQRTKKQILAFASGLQPAPRVVLGKKVVNFVHPDSPHKGDAVVELMRLARTKHAFYIGDDRTDEDVFRLRRKEILTVRVGYKRDSAADFYIPSQVGIDRLLRKMERFLGAKHSEL
jgi:trehalose 6-phosphate phosphatase